ncbi:MAG: choice-of-anchor L domain-containing protein, partial [Psychroflexus sp.]|nr:choice-of-anchor L domain-containing protein [Psychroflexus sp.]
MKFITTIFIICLSYLSLSAQNILMQEGSFDLCTGTFFDSGGAGGDYNTSESFTLTLCPDGSNLQTVLEFSSFDLANDGDDQMTIYDADNPDPGAILGTFTGTLAGNPELNFIAATNANTSGCLTIVFESNTFFNATGWDAAISCRPPCQTITPEVADISPICNTNSSGQQFVPVNQPITFVGDATTSSGVTNDLTYEWDFQGTILSGQTVNQTFNNPGTIDASLTVTDSFGCFETINFTITVGDNLIIVDDNNFTLDQLVSEVLIQGECALVDNINSPLSAQASNAGFDSYGYFNKGCSNFPFEEGIVLSSEGVSGIPTGLPSENPFGPGDPDLSALGGGNTNDATVIEFEFTPFVDQIQFNYMFASDEYNFPSLSFVCSFADTFAFILSGPGISNTNDYDHDANPATPDLTLDLGGLNIALVPGTTVPVSAVNVHTNTSCAAGSLGEFAFPQFFDNTNVPPPYHKYDGQMRVLTAQADVIPGQVYTIKLAISDFSDSILNSAVFLEGGSFELGVNLGDDIVACEGEVETIEVFNGQTPPGFTFEWTQDGVIIPGENEPTLDVTETGEYCVIPTSSLVDCDDTEDCINVQFIPIFDENDDLSENLDIFECTSGSVPTFDLTQNIDTILDNLSNDFTDDFPDFETENPGLDPFEVTFYTSQQDAIDGINPITNPDTFTPPNVPFTIYYTVGDNLGEGCLSDVFSFVIDGFSPDIGQLNDLEACDEDADGIAVFDLTENDSNALNGENPNDIDISYHVSNQDAVDATNPISNPQAFENTSNPQTIWVRHDNNLFTDCFDVDSFQITPVLNPVINTPPQNLTLCGDFTLTQTFNMIQNDADALGIANPGDAVLTYHNTQADADAGTNAIANPANYTPANNPETIFIRAENIADSNCFSTTSFILEIFDVETNLLEDLEKCAQTGNSGQTEFDLTAQNSSVFGTNQNSTTHSISYHISQADADGGVNPIATPNNYTSTDSPQTIWVRVQNNDDPSCYALESFNLIVIEQPEIVNNPIDLSLCGDFTNSQIFDLTQNNAGILGILNPTETLLSYHNTQADADDGTNAIVDPNNYSPTNNPETIFVRTENINNSNCFATASFSIQIFDVEANQPQDIVVCAPTGDTGQTQFDLTQQNNVVFGPNQDTTTHSISYHTSDDDAQNGDSPILNPNNYTNTTNPEPIWVRIQNNGNPSCFSVVSFQLSVTEESEILNPPVTLSQCSDFTATPVFDLTQYDAANLGILNAGETQITYHNTAADANTGDNPIPNPANYQPANAQEDIFIRAANVNDDSCFVTTSFSIEVFNVEILPANNIENCDDGAGTATSSFDLTSNTVTVLGPNQNSSTHNVTYHETQPDATGGVNPIGDPTTYQNTSNPQTIWVRVENQGDTSCF